MMATTTLDLIEESRQRLLSGLEERLNRLDGAINATDLTFAVKYDLKGIAPGMIVCVDLEEVRVWETAGKQATVVERAVNGTPPAAHADLATVEIGPRFSRARILRAMNEELTSLSSPANGLFEMRQVQVTFNPVAAGYDLVGVTSLDDIWQVETKVSGLSGDWRPIDVWRVDPNANTTDFPSGLALFLYGAGQAGQPVRVWYRASFTLLSTIDVTVDVATTGLPVTAFDLLPLGAIIRLVPPRDIKRTFTESQGEPRRAQEVPPNTASQSTSSIRQFRKDRIAEEAARLSRRYPLRRRRTA